MKWYEQSASEYEGLVGRQLLASQGGAKWYGAYIILKQVIAQNMNDDVSTWGYVAEGETKSTLAEKCGLSDDEFRLFIAFCNDRFIFEQKNNKLFCQSILEEKNQYAKKVLRRKAGTRDTCIDSADSSDSTDKKDKSIQSDVTTQHNHNTTHINLSNDKLVSDQQVSGVKTDLRNENVEFLLSLFQETWGFYPTDKQPRKAAWNFVQRIQTFLKKREKEPTNERVQAVLTAYVKFLKTKGWAANIQKVETFKLKFSIFESEVQRKESRESNPKRD